MDASLLRLDANSRYTMHELLRRFAAEQLLARPAMYEATVERFCQYFGARIEQYAAPLARERQQVADSQFDMENIRSVWMHLLRRSAVAEISRCLDGMHRFHEIHNWDRQGSELFAAGLEILPDTETAADIRARIAARLAVFAIRLADYTRAARWLEASLDHAAQPRPPRRRDILSLSDGQCPPASRALCGSRRTLSRQPRPRPPA